MKNLKKSSFMDQSSLPLADLIPHCIAQRRLPMATYRLQFNREFTLRDATAIVPYLHALGITDCYASPLFQARKGSMHGYDVCDPTKLNPEVGTDEDFTAFTQALAERGMGLLLDVVPNHMGIADATNTWWMDVLENGPSSVYAPCFDIDWDPVNPALFQKVLLPVLGDQYGKVLEQGHIKVVYDEGAFFIVCYDRRLPLSPRSYVPILERQVAELVKTRSEDDEHVTELRSIITAIGHLPPREDLDPEKIEERNREKEVIKRRLAALHDSDLEVQSCLAETLRVLNGVPGDSGSFDALDELLLEQPYRLAYWRVATEEINYRRFFDIDDLAAVRTENPLVFQATHELVFEWLAAGKVTGLRIDHPDGLWDPEQYFRRLQEMFVTARVRAEMAPRACPDDLDQTVTACLAEARARDEGTRSHWPLYVVAEKILSEDEPLPTDWAIDGTTGYDFLNLLNGLFVYPGSEHDFDDVYRVFGGEPRGFSTLVRNCKKMIMLVSMAGEINALAHQLDRVSEQNRQYRDFTHNSLTFVIREVIACMKVYRSYVTGRGEVTPRDRRFVTEAVATAKRLNPRTAGLIFDFVRDTLLLDNLSQFREQDRDTVVEWTMKFQQISGPIMAKGVEDTSFYVFNRFVSLNEVGGHPNHWGTSLEEFHRANVHRFEHWPHAMLATSTHDTKRSEDVRARLNVLSEMPDEWRAAVTRWATMNADKKREADGDPAPDANDEYLLYQTLIGVWPEWPIDEQDFATFRDRIVAYMGKATREAKVHTSWINPADAYDTAVGQFVRRVLPDDPRDPFRVDFDAFQKRVAYFGRYNALAQTLLKMTCPGMPDFYQGTELWNHFLVDPDNRQQVDFDARQAVMSRLNRELATSGGDIAALAGKLLGSLEDGAIKLHLISRVLRFRREHRQLFEEGEYVPLECQGELREQVCAFARVLDRQAVVVAVPRWFARLSGWRDVPPLGREIWAETTLDLPAPLEGMTGRDLFTGASLVPAHDGDAKKLYMADLFHRLPFAVVEFQATAGDPPLPPVD